MATIEAPRTEVRAEARYVRTAPRKAQLVAEQIRGRTVPEARTILTFMTRDAARDVQKVLESAVANAEANHGLAGDDLYVSAAFVGSGPTLKRWRARARGRVARIKKRTCHITLHLAVPGDEAIPEPRGSVTIEPPSAEEDVTGRTPSSTPRGGTQGKRSPRKQPEADVPVAEAAAPVAEEKPKRAPRKKADTDPVAKPKRAPRRRKTDGEES